jgi:hypothetical protein
MTDPLSYPAVTPRHALPLLFPGQAQKEAFVNAAHALADSLLHPAIEGEAAAPPASPDDGECWLVAAGASGEFAGKEGQLACRQAGVWLFAAPVTGMRAFDRSSGQHVLFADGWRRETPPAPVTGGATVDSEARAALDALVAALRRCGIFASA